MNREPTYWGAVWWVAMAIASVLACWAKGQEPLPRDGLHEAAGWGVRYGAGQPQGMTGPIVLPAQYCQPIQRAQPTLSQEQVDAIAKAVYQACWNQIQAHPEKFVQKLTREELEALYQRVHGDLYALVLADPRFRGQQGPPGPPGGQGPPGSQGPRGLTGSAAELSEQAIERIAQRVRARIAGSIRYEVRPAR